MEQKIDVVLSGAKNLYDYLRDPSLSLRATQLCRSERSEEPLRQSQRPFAEFTLSETEGLMATQNI